MSISIMEIISMALELQQTTEYSLYLQTEKAFPNGETALPKLL